VKKATPTQELTKARATITRLSHHHAQSVGWDTRLKALIQDKDELQQERDSESHRARAAEQRLEVLNDKCCKNLLESRVYVTAERCLYIAKLRVEVQRLGEGLQHQRQHRLELSEEVLKDARSRLEMLQHIQLGHSVPADESEVTKILETLVADNEDLKRNNAELQNLLGESREDVHALNKELDELRAVGVAEPPPRLFLPPFCID
jgi:chromosome segregation ATPase